MKFYRLLLALPVVVLLGCSPEAVLEVPLVFLEPEVTIEYVSGASGADIYYRFRVDSNPSSSFAEQMSNDVEGGRCFYTFNVENIQTYNITQDSLVSTSPTSESSDADSVEASFMRLITVDGSGGNVNATDQLLVSLEGWVSLSIGLDNLQNQYWFSGTETFVAN